MTFRLYKWNHRRYWLPTPGVGSAPTFVQADIKQGLQIVDAKALCARVIKEVAPDNCAGLASQDRSRSCSESRVGLLDWSACDWSGTAPLAHYALMDFCLQQARPASLRTTSQSPRFPPEVRAAMSGRMQQLEAEASRTLCGLKHLLRTGDAAHAAPKFAASCGLVKKLSWALLFASAIAVSQSRRFRRFRRFYPPNLLNIWYLEDLVTQVF